MIIANVSERGQICIPASARKKLGIKPKSKVSVEVGDTEITIRPMKCISDVEGIFRKKAKGRKPDWDKERAVAGKAVARGVNDETKR